MYDVSRFPALLLLSEMLSCSNQPE